MFKPKMIEDLKDFICKNKHSQPVHMVILDSKLDKKQRLLCTQCLQSFFSDQKIIGLKKVIEIIEDKQESKISNLENKAQQTFQQLQKCITTTQQLRCQYLNLFDSIIRISQDWSDSLMVRMKQICNYSFYDELDDFIKKGNAGDCADIKLIDDINRSWMTKLYNNINKYNQDSGKLKINELKQQFIKIINKNSFKNDVIKFKLINESLKQSKECYAIVFDSSGSIMVSSEYNKINVWNFQYGIELRNTLNGHKDQILCLIYSKKQNFFISGSSDQTIRCWKQINQNEWNSSEPHKHHTNYVICIIMNSNEDLLFSGGGDKTINVWKIDFNLNKLTYFYSLQKHSNQVIALSLNQSENQLVSCAKDKDQIIIWERGEYNKYEFKYFVKQSIQEEGMQVKFINDNQFLWISGGTEIDKIFSFEIKDEIFQENQENTVQLIKNNQISDDPFFPIVHNKERNLILLRHKKYIYLIRMMNQGQLKVIDQLNCKTHKIYGTVRSNWQQLVYWDFTEKQYFISEL